MTEKKPKTGAKALYDPKIREIEVERRDIGSTALDEISVYISEPLLIEDHT